MGSTPSSASAVGVRPVTMPVVDRVASAVVTGVPPIMVGLGMWFGWSGNLLNWQDLLILALFYAGVGTGITVGFHRLLTHGSFKCHRLTRAAFAALGSAAAEGPVIDWVATHRKHHQFSDVHGDPHSPHVGHGSGWLERDPRARARAHRMGLQRHGGGRRAALRQGPAGRPVDPIRQRHVRALGDRRAGCGLRARRRAQRHRGRRLDRAVVGRGGPDLLHAPRHVQHQLALPLLRAPGVRHPTTSRATWRGSRSPPGARRGTTTTTRFRAPTATACAAGRSIRRRGSSG